MREREGLSARATPPAVGETPAAMRWASPVRSRLPRTALLVAMLSVGNACAYRPPSGPAAQAGAVRHPRWAKPLAVAGAPNLFRVSGTLYRGAQPSETGLRVLRSLGVRTVVSLRAFHAEGTKVRALGLGFKHVRFAVWHPEDEDAVRFLRVAADPERVPVFVHCKRGADRTGLMVALYRICVEGWTSQDAVAEMTGGGFGFNPRWRHLVRWVERADTRRLAAEAGLATLAGARGNPDGE